MSDRPGISWGPAGAQSGISGRTIYTTTDVPSSSTVDATRCSQSKQQERLSSAEAYLLVVWPRNWSAVQNSGSRGERGLRGGGRGCSNLPAKKDAFRPTPCHLTPFLLFDLRLESFPATFKAGKAGQGKGTDRRAKASREGACCLPSFIHPSFTSPLRPFLGPPFAAARKASSTALATTTYSASKARQKDR